MRKFIVFDGQDGTGKGTQMELAVAYLQAKFGKDQVVQTKEPGGTEFGMLVRRLMFFDFPTTKMAPGVVDLLFLASHIQNNETIVKPALDAGKIVVCDRWFYSQAAYSTQRYVPPAITAAYDQVHGEYPGLFVFLHGDTRTMLERANRREGEKHQANKEWNELEKLEKIQEAYALMFSNRPEFYPVCVNDKGAGDIFCEVKEGIDGFLNV